MSTISSGSAVTLTAAVVAGGNPVTRGTVDFCDATAAYCTDIHIVGSAQITSAGTAIYRLVPGFGTHRYKAVFVGTNVNPSSSSATQTLNVTGLISTSTYLSSQGNPGNYSLYATMQSPVSASPPTGKVSFLDTTNGNSPIGSGALTSLGASNGFVGGGSDPLIGSSVAAADLNGDGKVDILASDLVSRGRKRAMVAALFPFTAKDAMKGAPNARDLASRSGGTKCSNSMLARLIH